MYIDKDNSVVASLTAPGSVDELYLTDTKRWRHLGSYATDAVIQLTNKLHVLSNNSREDILEISGLSGVQAALASASFENLTGAGFTALLDEEHLIDVSIVFALSSSVNETLSYAFNEFGVTPSSPDMEVFTSQISNLYYQSFSKLFLVGGLQTINLIAKMRGNNTNHSTDLSTVRIIARRKRI